MLTKKFSALNADFSSLGLDPLWFKEACAGGRQRGTTKKWLFYRYWLV